MKLNILAEKNGKVNFFEYHFLKDVLRKWEANVVAVKRIKAIFNEGMPETNLIQKLKTCSFIYLRTSSIFELLKCFCENKEKLNQIF